MKGVPYARPSGLATGFRFDFFVVVEIRDKRNCFECALTNWINTEWLELHWY